MDLIGLITSTGIVWGLLWGALGVILLLSSSVSPGSPMPPGKVVVSRKVVGLVFAFCLAFWLIGLLRLLRIV